MYLGVDRPRLAVVAIDLHRGHLDPAVATMPLPAACSDVELVALLVGPKTAAKLYQGSLLKLLYHDAHPRLAAAMELVRRSLHETLQQKPALNSPSTVRDYLRLLLSGKEHEAHWPDNRHEMPCPTTTTEMPTISALWRSVPMSRSIGQGSVSG